MILNENMVQSGEGLISALAAFRNMEQHTKYVRRDISVMDVIIPVGEPENGTMCAYIRNDGPLIVAQDGVVTLNAESLTMKVPADFQINDYPIVFMGESTKNLTLQSEDVYLTSQNFMKILRRKLKIQGTTKGNALNNALAEALQTKYKPIPVTLVYREENGIKKLFTFVKNLENVIKISIDEVTQAVRRTASLTGHRFTLTHWQIRQAQRTIEFVDENGNVMKFVYGDISRCEAANVTYLGQKIRIHENMIADEILGFFEIETMQETKPPVLQDKVITWNRTEMPAEQTKAKAFVKRMVV